MDDATYVRRRRWSAQEKRAVVAESVTSGNVIATAKRHGIQAQQIYRWRERLEAQPAPGAFLSVAVASDLGPSSPAPVPASLLDGASRDRDPTSRPERSPRVEIVLSAGRRIIVEGGIEVDAVLALARGLEGFR
ncbi:transposase [Methylobacterium sp. WL12]|uniref:transposase n=1 Tax=Methylobacterium sp. WL12 TaxID=2603890 RepID=UPI0011C89260|nr:transposase [Methylobacterium sp. WL12]TXM66583.1 transposase [Methylobacterium sp. WL12]